MNHVNINFKLIFNGELNHLFLFGSMWNIAKFKFKIKSAIGYLIVIDVIHML